MSIFFAGGSSLKFPANVSVEIVCYVSPVVFLNEFESFVARIIENITQIPGLFSF